jgi:hypothetical protein
MLVDLTNHALFITGFVGIMMLVIEYINVMTRGTWQNSLTNHKWTQYLMAVLLGASPGCLGAFAVVAMYSHRVVSLGALFATMIATSGDEAFVMLAMFPGKALILTGILIVIGLIGGWLTDVFVTKRVAAQSGTCENLEIHTAEACQCFPKDEIIMQWKQLSPARGVLVGALLLFIFGIATGSIGSQEWDWKRITLLVTSLVGFFIVATVPEHFLQEHLWRHIALKHVHRVFLWTFGALLVTHVITNELHLGGLIQNNVLTIILIACLVGIIPESGPHLFFVTLFAQGSVPFSVLLASSVVQDGHGMLPLLAHSRKQFMLVKAINFLIGLLVGLLVYFAGW